MEADRVSMIDLTPDDVIAANMAALGLAENMKRPMSDRVLEAFKAYIEEHKRIPRSTEIAALVDSSVTSVRTACRVLADEGRMLRFVDKATGQNAYIPKVV